MTLTHAMKLSTVIVLLIATGIAIMFFIGYSMPIRHTISKKLILNASAEEVWNVITDYKGYVEWRRGVEKVDVIDSRHWTEKSNLGEIHYEAEVFTPQQLFVSRIKNKDLAFGGSWSFKLKQENPQVTVLQITEVGEVYNPFFRFMAKYILGHEATLNEYAQDLSKKING
jgi:hypothetical protein